ncbi:hypothetical protein Vadar_030960 [Vaccinium darrowii]|uniref:Uncharacterized protein n=1 Tax=Vaccinium darrowii TaxID=229202 RepID=A0ACB7Z0G5_9ERIC|nr:hypothetical protein Vadar_030960 [Vaccinium darrowii]
MRQPRFPAISFSSSPFAVSSTAVRGRHCFPPSTVRSRQLGFDEGGSSKYWDKFYKRHQNKFFKDRHYLEKDWGKYFSDDSSASPNGKVVLEVGCGAGNTVFPLVAKHPKLFVHACDFSPQAIAIVKSHVDFNEDRVNTFLCDIVNDDLCDTMMPSSIDVVTLPDGHILLRDYAIGDYAQVELDKRNQMITENFYVRGDGTSAFYFSEEFLSTLFGSAGFTIVDMDVYSRQIHNRSRNITMSRKLTYSDMNRREDVARRLYEACLSGSVPALDSLIEEDPFILDRVSSLTGFFNDTPLHLAALRGHLDFTKALLTRKPKLATELDSLRCSPLHLASAEGHVEVVQALLRVNTEVCVARDQDGRIPLHLAAMKGREEIIRELLGAKPNSIHEKLSRGETVFHLCVKYNRLEALKSLVQYVHSNGMESLHNSGDGDGNTILHLAAALKQMDAKFDSYLCLTNCTIEYLLGIKSVKDYANVKNQNGSTALDVLEHCPNRDLKTMEIREFLLQAGIRTSICGGLDPNPKSPSDIPPPLPSQRRCKAQVILQCIYRFWIKYLKADPTWLQQVRGHLLTTATLTATVAYQAVLSPPGGFWQESGKGFKVEEAVMDTYHSRYYPGYLLTNTGMLIASLSTIMLALSGFPNHNKFLTWMLVYTVYVTLSCMVVAYVLAIILVAPQAKDDFKLSLDISIGLEFCWMGICGFVVLLHTFHFFVWLWNKFSKIVRLRNMFVNLVKSCHRSSRGPIATRDVTTELVNPAGKP